MNPQNLNLLKFWCGLGNWQQAQGQDENTKVFGRRS